MRKHRLVYRHVILAKGSVIAPKAALLKPVSAAVSPGAGGPFGSTVARLRRRRQGGRRLLVEVGQDGEDPPVVVFRRGQVQLGEEARGVFPDGLL
jgi:hypothetical protein